MQEIGMIVACDINGTIGYDGDLPWRNKTDLIRFKELTQDGTLIMGRKTYESIPISKKYNTRLPNRVKYVISSTAEQRVASDDTKWFKNIKSALISAPEDKNIWIIGGATIYEEALNLAIPDFIDLTILNFMFVGPVRHSVNEVIQKRVVLPSIPYNYMVTDEVQNADDSILWHRHYKRRPGGFARPYMDQLKSVGDIKMISNTEKTIYYGDV